MRVKTAVVDGSRVRHRHRSVGWLIALFVQRAPQLAHTSDADDQHDGGTAKGGDEQCDCDGHAPRNREELDRLETSVLDDEVNESDAEDHADDQGEPGPADPRGFAIDRRSRRSGSSPAPCARLFVHNRAVPTSPRR